jgi:hypothetical protein
MSDSKKLPKKLLRKGLDISSVVAGLKYKAYFTRHTVLFSVFSQLF